MRSPKLVGSYGAGVQTSRLRSGAIGYPLLRVPILFFDWLVSVIVNRLGIVRVLLLAKHGLLDPYQFILYLVYLLKPLQRKNKAIRSKGAARHVHVHDVGAARHVHVYMIRRCTQVHCGGSFFTLFDSL